MTTTNTLVATRRLAVVATESPLTLYLGGDTTNQTPATTIDTYTPHANDVVVVLEAGGDYIVIGAVNTAQPNGTQPGVMTYWATSTVPNGWLLCNGQAVSRATYSRLFATMGTLWGAGDGTNTFNVPDLVGYFVQGGTGPDGTARGASTHTHPLSSNGYSQMQLSASILEVKAIGGVSYTGTVKLSSVTGAAASDALTQGVSLGGNTDSASSLPPYKILPVIIKT